MHRFPLASKKGAVGTPCSHCEQLSQENGVAKGNGAHAQAKAVLEPIYMAVLCLADETAEMSALLFDDDAAEFLTGLPPADLSMSTATLEEITSRFRRLTVPPGATVPPYAVEWKASHAYVKTPPEVQTWMANLHILPARIPLCLKAYTVHTQNGPARRFRVFNTICM